MQPIDCVIVGLYLIISFSVAVYFSKRAGKNIEEFFLSGRRLPWWVAGTSMVATTFATDTPLAVTELVARNGIAGNWLWWNFILGGMLTVFFFARLWRRAAVVTDVEFIELRYSGKSGAFLRGFRALYLGLFINVVVMGWVNLAMISILEGMFGIPSSQVRYYVFGAMLFVAVYSALAGLWGVAFNDAIQFVIAMTGTTILMFVVLRRPEVGGISGLQAQLPDWVFQFTPVVGGVEAVAGGALTLTVSAFVAYIFIQWWASWYPGSEPGGGGFIAQRMLSAKDEKHALLATLWFTIAHYCLRPWPWILVGLATLVLYPDLGPEEKRLGYIYAMRDFLPAGLKGLLVATFLAAYMSTITTLFNWGTSYLVNDFYKRFLNTGASDRHYVFVSRSATFLLMVASVLVTLVIHTISGAWQFIIEAGAGIGLVLILRFYWWRINAWSEIVATIVPFFVYGYVSLYTEIAFPVSLYYIVSVTTVAWLAVTMLTSPVEQQHLIRFYEKVRPGGIGWSRLHRAAPHVQPDSGFGWLFVDWLCGTILVYGSVFGVGKLIFGHYALGLSFLLVGGLGGAVIYWDVSRRGWEQVVGE